MRLWVDPYRCLGHSVCLARAPHLLVFDEERGQAVATGDDVGEEFDEEAEAAVQVCPERAIFYFEHLVTHQLTLLNTKQTFDTASDETILDALLRQGVAVRYGCRRGKCATCKHFMVDGDYDNSAASAYALLDGEREEGMTLLCQTYALSDCTVELLEDAAAESRIRPATPRATVGTVVSAGALGRVGPQDDKPRVGPQDDKPRVGPQDDKPRVGPQDDKPRVGPQDDNAAAIWSVQLELSVPLHPLPGQYVEVAAPDGGGVTRTFSVASAPFDVRTLELIVRRFDGGAFSGHLDRLAPGTELAVSGPYGHMFLRPSPRPTVLLGDEAGIAPMLSMARYSGECGWPPGMRVLHVAVAEDDLVYRAELTAWAAGGAGFSYDVFDRLAAAVAHAITGEDVDVYVAGEATFCDQATFLLEARGVNSNQIYVERFFPAE